MVILRVKNPKTQEITNLPPFKLPPDYKDLALQDTAVEARHFAATYALFRICSMRNIHMMLPPNYRDLWKGDFAELKKADVKAGRASMYEADPFLALREKEEAQAQMAKKREAQNKAKAAFVAQPGLNQPGPTTTGGGKVMTRGWASAPKVEMGKRARKEVEALVRSQATWNPYGKRLCTEEKLQVVDELVTLGFRKSHIEEAADICRDREEILEWLLIHVPEDDLPNWSLPEGYVSGVSLASGNLKREGAVKRLAVGGYASELCEEVYDTCGGDEMMAAQTLQQSLVEEIASSDLSVSVAALTVDDEANIIWNEEQNVLLAIYAGRYKYLGKSSCEIPLEIPSLKTPITAIFHQPRGPYPSVLPILIISAALPAYIRLSIIRKVLAFAQDNFLGEQMIFNLVDWLEREIPDIIEDPGTLAEVSAVISAGAPTTNTSGAEALREQRARRRPRPINMKVGTDASLRMLTQWEARQNTAAQQKMLRGRQSLPAWKLQDAIAKAVETYQVVIVSGETGSGKSTQSVQFILDDLIKRKMGDTVNIICTQPRRISALGLADRVADERCTAVGQEIGYAIRGESKQSPGITKITFVTTGVLLRRLQTSGGSTDDVVASLADVSHVVVDEVHERSLDTDFLLALLRDVLRKRKDLKVILMSATLDAEVFANYFGGPKLVGLIEIQGRTYPVEDYYIDDVMRMTGFGGRQQLEEDDEEVSNPASMGGSLRSLGMGINYDLIAATVRQIDLDLGDQEGGILIFLPGTMEINKALDALRSIPRLHALPLHASLMPAEQRRVFPRAPAGKRKVIAATNVAETSITIEDVVAVIDTGRVKETRYDPQNSMVKLEEVWASRAACKQRRGRAGRVQAGKCYKLFTRALEAGKMTERPEPEIRRVPLEQLCLSVKAMGVPDVSGFLANTLTPPEVLAVEGALNLLQRIGALDGDLLTALGRHLAMIPADLRCAKLMVYGALFGVLEACVTIASILTVKSPFVSPQDKREESKAARTSFGGNQGDVIADLRAYETWSELKSTSSFRETRGWCEQNFLSANTLNDISTTRSQYFSSLKEIGFLPVTYHSSGSDGHLNRNGASNALLNSLVLASLHPQTLRIALPTQKYAPTMTGTLALDPSAREIRFFDSDAARIFVHPSSTLFTAQSFNSGNAPAGFLSYFTKVATSKPFARDLTPCGSYGMLLFGGPIELDTMGRGLIVDGWVRLRGWARIGVLVGRLRGVLDQVLARWVEDPGSAGKGEVEGRVVDLVRRLVELEGMDR